MVGEGDSVGDGDSVGVLLFEGLGEGDSEAGAYGLGLGLAAVAGKVASSAETPSSVTVVTAIRILWSYQTFPQMPSVLPVSTRTASRSVMQPSQAEQIVELLREKRIMAHVQPKGLQSAAIRVVLPGGREAIWDGDAAAGLEAQVMADGMLVGFVPLIEGSENFDVVQSAEAIAAADYG